MPIYDYECRSCGERQEVYCKINDRPDTMPCCRCPGDMHQIITTMSIQCDDAVNIPWLQDFARTRPEARFKKAPPIATRREYRKYLQDHGLRDPHKGENLTEI